MILTIALLLFIRELIHVWWLNDYYCWEFVDGHNKPYVQAIITFLLRLHDDALHEKKKLGGPACMKIFYIHNFPRPSTLNKGYVFFGFLWWIVRQYNFIHDLIQ